MSHLVNVQLSEFTYFINIHIFVLLVFKEKKMQVTCISLRITGFRMNLKSISHSIND